MEFLQTGILLQIHYMKDISTAVNDPSAPFRCRAGVRRMIKHHLKIDMTPMVDLGFLLITFFVITTELSKPTAMNLYMPADGLPMDLGKSNALTILLDRNDGIYFYNGDWKEALFSGGITKTNFSGKNSLREVIMKKQHWLDINNKTKEGRNGLMLLIKPGAGASYKNVVDALDEATINVVKKYAVVKISAEEISWLKEKNK